MMLRIVSYNIAQERSATPLPHNVKMWRPDARRSHSRSAVRALDILEYFGQVRRPLRAMEISRALGVHTSTADQLLKTLVESCHLIFDARTKLYKPSPRLAAFAGWVSTGYYGGDRLGEMMRDLGALTGHSITLSTPDDLSMQLLVAVAGPRPRAFPERGTKVPLFGSALGGAHLATLEDDEISELAHRARLGVEERESLIDGVQRIRKDGYAFGGIVAMGDADEDLRSLAIALPAPALETPLVLGLAGESVAVDGEVEQLLAQMREAVAGLYGGEEL